ncbi:hypothetical protein BKA63DRAFT_607678 [Paraphoma chrysanthemicola]|nr:hypothetical protein BKA63DRAFT_607678 [Paraphoma chrysanthemicola]
MASYWDDEDHEMESDSEVALDLKGRKHVDKSGNADATADALRSFLGGLLPLSAITDEYGHVTPIAHVANDHLPTLQARLWDVELMGSTSPWPQVPATRTLGTCSGVTSQYRTARIPPTPQRAVVHEDRRLLAQHVNLIFELLDDNYVFILDNNSTNTCDFAGCRLPSSDSNRPSPLVTIEPLIHWGTLTPAFDSSLCRGRVLAFRRNGEMCKDPLWTQAIGKFTPPDPPKYCGECLEMLMDKRAIAWTDMERSRPSSFTAVNGQCRRIALDKARQLRSSRDTTNVRQLGAGQAPGVDSQQGFQVTHPEVWDEKSTLAALALDGPSEADVNTKQDSVQCFSSASRAQQTQKHGLTKIEDLSSDTSLRLEQDLTSLDSHNDNSTIKRRKTLSIASQRPCERPNTITAWERFDHGSPTPLSPPADFAHIKSDPQPKVRETLKSDKSQQKNLYYNSRDEQHGKTAESPRNSHKTQRKFGREISANAVVNAVKKSTPSKPDMVIYKQAANGTTNIGSFLTSETILSLEDHPSRSTQSTMMPRHAPKQRLSNSSWVTTDESTISEDDNSALEPPEPKTTTPPKRKIKPASKKKPPPPPKPTTLKDLKPTKPQPPFTPFLAKHAKLSITDIPSHISEYTFPTSIARIPQTKEIICHCRKPARTPHIQLAQCANMTCNIGWYHYECLDKSGKIRARHGTMLCQYCRNEGYFREVAERNGSKLVEGELSVPFSAVDVLARMPGPGGVLGVRDPYGLATMSEVPRVDGQASVYEKGALGRMALFGYEDAVPEMLGEAYRNGKVHRAEWMAREAEEEEAERAGWAVGNGEGEECECGYGGEWDDGGDEEVEHVAEHMELD